MVDWAGDSVGRLACDLLAKIVENYGWRESVTDRRWPGLPEAFWVSFPSRNRGCTFQEFRSLASGPRVTPPTASS